MIISKKSESCQMVNMTCKCKKTSENELKFSMNCVEPRLLNEILLDFNHFKIETNETIELTIEKKLISRIISSSQNSLVKHTNILKIKNNQMKTLAAYSFRDFSSLNELFLSNNGLETLDNKAFKGLESSLKKLELLSNKIKQVDNDLVDNLFLGLTMWASLTISMFKAFQSMNVCMVKNIFNTKVF